MKERLTAQEQIKEMEKIIDEKAFEYCDSDGCIYSDKLAKILFLAGYRRITPNVDFIVRAGELSTIQENARKETAKEIIQWVSKMQKACYTDEAIIGHLMAHYGVEVEK